MKWCWHELWYNDELFEARWRIYASVNWIIIGKDNACPLLPIPMLNYRLVSNIRRISNIRRSPTLGNSQLEFSTTISLAKTSNTRRTPSFDPWVLIVDKVWSRPTWSELLRVAWDYDSPWITGPMTAHQSVAYVRHITLAPTANLCTLSAIVSLTIKAWIWCHLRRYIDGSAILLTVKGPVWPRWLKISPCVTTKIMWNTTAFR